MSKVDKEELQKLLDRWNDFAMPLGLIKRKTRVTDKRLKHFRKRYEDPEFLECFDDILNEIKNSDFLLGRVNQTGKHENWRISIDTILERENFWVRILEGTYSNRDKMPGSNEESLSLDSLMEENEARQ